MSDLSACLPREVAEELALFRASDEVQSDIDHLANRCADGQATASERAEYETLMAFFDYLDLLRLLVLKHTTRREPPDGGNS